MLKKINVKEKTNNTPNCLTRHIVSCRGVTQLGGCALTLCSFVSHTYIYFTFILHWNLFDQL